MKKTIIISPFSRKLRNDKRNPKNFPYWDEVTEVIRKKKPDVMTIQVGIPVEENIGADERKDDLGFEELADLVRQSHLWMSVDSFFQHFCNAYKLRRGIVIFGPSDPLLFGYSHNINLIKDRSCMRPDQWNIWEALDYKKSVFPSVKDVITATFSELEKSEQEKKEQK